MNQGACNGRWKGGLARFVAQAAQLLGDAPMTRYELQCALRTSQQRASEVLRLIGAHVVGQRPPAGKRGRPSPVYGLCEPAPRCARMGRVSSVWELGAPVNKWASMVASVEAASV